MPAPRPLFAIGLMLLAVLCFAALDATSKTLSQTFAVPLLVWARYTFHFLLMVVFLAPSMKIRLIATRRPRLQVLRALMLVGTTGFAMASFRTMPLAEATAILFVTPLAVALLAGPLLGERVGTTRWIAVVAGFGGMLLVARPGGAMSAAGIAWALAAAACYTIYQIQTRMLSPSENTWTMLFYTALVGTVAMSLGLPLFWSGALPTPLQALMIASLGIYGGTGHFLLIRAFRHVAASTLSPFLYAQLVWAAVFGWLFYGHVPDGISIAGMAIIAGSSIAMAAFEQRRPC
ncbi:MAG: DMT family transporter [Rhodocyclaceae bacterium]|nr:DMT family transporter [Rhodocyclaceae bacterium]